MATVTVKFRPSKINGEKGVIIYKITHNRKTGEVKTKLKVFKSEWNYEKLQIRETSSKYEIVKIIISNDLECFRRIISRLENRVGEYSVTDVIRKFEMLKSSILLTDFMRVQIEQLKSENRYGTANNYEKVLRSMEKFLDGLQLPLSAVNERLIENYNVYLINKRLVRNSISFYMRILRAVYNKAVRQKLIEQAYPFISVYTGVDHTRKRAVSESIILQLNRLDLSNDSQLAFVRDLFIFSYCTRGMAFVDMAYLCKSDLHNGVISYARRKTGQLLMIKIEDNIQRIIDRYKPLNTPYVFPILISTNAIDAYKQYQKALNDYNRGLAKLSKELGCKLTSYTSRHSWATAARNHNIPISIISAGMGHTTEQTTKIYLTMLENSKIDEANKEIINNLI